MQILSVGVQLFPGEQTGMTKPTVALLATLPTLLKCISQELTVRKFSACHITFTPSRSAPLMRNLHDPVNPWSNTPTTKTIYDTLAVKTSAVRQICIYSQCTKNQRRKGCGVNKRRDARFSERWIWRLRRHTMWRRVVWQISTAVSEEPTSMISGSSESY